MSHRFLQSFILLCCCFFCKEIVVANSSYHFYRKNHRINTNDVVTSIVFANGKAKTDTKRCYSCMSPVYELMWDKEFHLLYNRPVNFTPDCDYPFYGRYVRTVECDSVCIHMEETFYLHGSEHYLFIRGCFDSILRHPNYFNSSIVHQDNWLRAKLCRKYHRNELFTAREVRVHPYAPPYSKLLFCTCFGDFCNSSLSAHHNHWLQTVLLLLTLRVAFAALLANCLL